MTFPLKQSTSKAISFGPFVDKADGVTPEVGLVSAIDHATTGILLSKNGGALTIRSQAVTASTYDAYGNYIVTLSTTDTATLGTLRMQFIETATCLPVWMDFVVLPATVFDAIVTNAAGGANGFLLSLASNQVDVGKLLGTAWLPPIVAGTPDVNTKLAGGTAWGSGAITAGAIAADAITDAKVAADVTIASVTGSVGSVTGAVGSVTGSVGSVAGNVTGNVVGSVASVTAGVTLAASAVQAIWDALTSALTTAGSIGKIIVDNLNATVGSRASQTSADDLPTNAELATALAAADDVVLAAMGTPMQAGTTVVLTDGSLSTAKLGSFVLAKTTNISGFNDIAATAIVSGGAIGTSAGAVSLVTTVTTVTTLAGHTAQTGDTFARLGAPAGASVSADIAAAKVDAAAIKAKTDQFVFTVAGQVDANALTGSAGTGSGLNAIPWNAAWDAEVQSEVADALAVYVPATAEALVLVAAEVGKVQRCSSAIAAGASANWINYTATPDETILVGISVP